MPQRVPDEADVPVDPWHDLATAVLGMSPKDRIIYLSTLEPDDLAVVEHAIGMLTGQGWRATPDAMAAHLDVTYRRPPYIKILGDAYRRCVVEDGARIIINLPARYGKSLCCSQWGPAWGLDLHPDSRSMLISYGDELAMENALACRDILDTHADVLTARLRRDARRRDRFLTEQGGGILARGMGSAIRGFGVTENGVLVCDDLFKDWIEAHSALTRQKKVDTYRSTIRDRLDSENAGILHIHHRVHEQDFTGHLLADMELGGEAWEHIVIPAIAAEGLPDALGREIGQVLDEARFTFEQVQTRHRALGPYVVASQEQQAPSSHQGVELLRSWFLLDMAPPETFDATLTSWDLKLKDREAGDFVVGQVWGRASGSFWMLDQIRGLFDHGTTANAIALLAVRWPDVTRHIVEAAGSFDEVIPQLQLARPDYTVSDDQADRLGMTEPERAAVQDLRRRGMFGLIPHPARHAKPIRARAYISPSAEAGQVHLDPDGPWVALLLEEIAAFPNGLHDDQVDAMSQALEMLATSPGVVSVAKRRSRSQGSGKPGRRVVRPVPK